MRHRKRSISKLGRDTSHRESMLANLVASLIEHRRIRTTLHKAKAARSVAEKLVTLGKRGDLHARRLAIARLHKEDSVRELFSTIAPAFKDRAGGYTRILKLGRRTSDAAEMALLEWVDYVPRAGDAAAAAAPEAEAKKD
jgi:large subunit ribosomal protein L17